MSGLLLHCRPGFEGECAAEIQDHATALNMPGYCKTATGSAYVRFYPYQPQHAAEIHTQLKFHKLIFARQWFVITDELTGLSQGDRVGPILSVCAGHHFNGLMMEIPDCNETKVLNPLIKRLGRHLDHKISKRNNAQQRLHICLTATDQAVIGWALPENAAPWSGGIPRLRIPRDAPSRATLKLEEAWLRLLTEKERETLLQPGMTSVDLGAAPGGWTWQLVKHHIRVIAIDNANMDDKLMDSGLVTHLKVDGFHYRPEKTVDWMVCDMVEKPSRVANIAGLWVSEGAARNAIFNLKLPMKKRYQEVNQCLELIREHMRSSGKQYHLRCKSLYQDREEVTVYLGLK